MTIIASGPPNEGILDITHLMCMSWPTIEHSSSMINSIQTLFGTDFAGWVNIDRIVLIYVHWLHSDTIEPGQILRDTNSAFSGVNYSFVWRET